MLESGGYPAVPRTEVSNTCPGEVDASPRRRSPEHSKSGVSATQAQSAPRARDPLRPQGGGARRPGPRPGASGSSPGPASSSPGPVGRPAEPRRRSRGIVGRGGPGGGGWAAVAAGAGRGGAGPRPEDGSEKVAAVRGRVGPAVRAPRRWEDPAVACPRSCWPSTRCAGRQFARSSRAGPRRE